MYSCRINLALAAVVLLAVACQPTLQAVPPLPSPEVWRVETTPALTWLGEIFQQCAASQSGALLVVNQHSAPDLDPARADFTFQWGERSNPAPFSAVIGQEELAVVVNPQNPISAINVADVKAIFIGQTTDWKSVLQTACPGCSANLAGAVKVYGYPRGEDAGQAGSWIEPGPDAILAPDPAAVLQAVAADANSIGFLPVHWLDRTVKKIELKGEVPGGLSRPVLAMAQAEPQGPKRVWLLCVQQKLQ
jgi:hypothetical protein